MARIAPSQWLSLPLRRWTSLLLTQSHELLQHPRVSSLLSDDRTRDLIDAVDYGVRAVLWRVPVAGGAMLKTYNEWIAGSSSVQPNNDTTTVVTDAASPPRPATDSGSRPPAPVSSLAISEFHLYRNDGLRRVNRGLVEQMSVLKSDLERAQHHLFLAHGIIERMKEVVTVCPRRARADESVHARTIFADASGVGKQSASTIKVERAYEHSEPASEPETDSRLDSAAVGFSADGVGTSESDNFKPRQHEPSTATCALTQDDEASGIQDDDASGVRNDEASGAQDDENAGGQDGEVAQFYDDDDRTQLSDERQVSDSIAPDPTPYDEPPLDVRIRAPGPTDLAGSNYSQLLALNAPDAEDGAWHRRALSQLVQEREQRRSLRSESDSCASSPRYSRFSFASSLEMEFVRREEDDEPPVTFETLVALRDPEADDQLGEWQRRSLTRLSEERERQLGSHAACASSVSLSPTNSSTSTHHHSNDET